MPAGKLRLVARAKPRPRAALSKKQKSEVRKLAASVVSSMAEDINKVFVVENEQLDHNKPAYVGNLLACEQGVADDNTQSSKQVRKGDKITLKNMNIRFWLSNKLDRPNVMYKGVLFWYQSGVALSDAIVYFTQTNKILDRYNTEKIRILDQFIVKPGPMFLNGTEKFEHSYLATLNKSYKRKIITYDENGTVPKGWDMGFALVAYDAYGTLQTDNIASFAYNVKLTFEDL